MHSGPLFGTLLYGIGGFGLPFWVIGALGIFLAVILYIIIPPVKQKDQKMSDGGTQLTIKGVTKVAVLNKGFNYCIAYYSFLLISPQPYSCPYWTVVL